MWYLTPPYFDMNLVQMVHIKFNPTTSMSPSLSTPLNLSLFEHPGPSTPFATLHSPTKDGGNSKKVGTTIITLVTHVEAPT